jgi:hypothetical protein
MQKDFDLYGELSFHFEMIEWVLKDFNYEKLGKAELKWMIKLQPAYCADFRLWLSKALIEKIGFNAICRLYDGDFIAIPATESLKTNSTSLSTR